MQSINKLAYLVAVIVYLTVVSSVGAVGDSTQVPQKKDIKREATAGSKAKSISCDKLGSFDVKVEGRIAEKQGKISDKRGGRGQKLEENRKTRDEKLNGLREARNEERQEHYAKLRERAQNDEQRAAVEKFILTVEEAIEVRKAAVDKAISDYRNGVDAAVSSRKEDIEALQTEFKEQVEAATAKAKVDCEAGVPVVTVRENLKNSLAAARQNLKNDLKDIEKVKVDVKAHGDFRKTAIGIAIEDFKITLEEARQELKAAFSA